jgi:hypothetical protein
MKKFMFAYEEYAVGVIEVWADDEDSARELAECQDGDVFINESNSTIGELIQISD